MTKEIINIGQPLYDMPGLWIPAGTSVETIEQCGAKVSLWSDGLADWCYVQGLLPGDLHASREAQTRSCFERIEQIVKNAGMTFQHVARTWFYDYLILEWYGEFNMARTLFFGDRGIERMPASTGVGMPNASGSALTCAALAIRPTSSKAVVREIESPEQCSAMKYKSSFARAMSYEAPGRNLMWISGTASIAPCGKTQYVGDVDKQIDRTLEVVGAILRSEKMDWSNMARSVGYFRYAADVPRFAERLRALGIPEFPIVFARAEICRDDLLFELEADAMSGMTK